MPEVVIKCLDPFKPLYDLPEGTNIVVLIGGRGGGKTYEASKCAAYSSTIKNKRIVVLRDEKELVRESILNEILLRYDTANSSGYLSRYFDRLDTGIKSKSTNEMLVFTKGFRASSTDKSANLKSISNIDIAIVEEAEDIRDENKFNTFADSIRKEGSVIIIILNTPDINHWIVKRYFNLELVEDGYFRLIPKNIKGFMCIQTSYKDNPYLPAHIVSNYENYGNPESHLYNKHYYLTSILGLASTGRKGQIITKAKHIKLDDYLALPYKEVYGQDFGTASPAGLIGAKIHRNTIWLREMNYKPMDALAIAKMYCTLKFSAGDRIVADSADDKACTRLESGWQGHELSDEDFSLYPQLRNGFNIIRARKGADSIEYGLNLLCGMNIFITEESVNFWNETFNYVYAQDKWGNYTNDPIDDFNHLWDPARYVVLDHDMHSGGGGMERVN
ncbi:MAG: phage terminase large subunit [Chitinophagaceae bacterium]|nr:phage terminase large subunit [Chitinophagaceae bacterium]